MFTGLIEDLGTVVENTPSAAGRRIAIQTSLPLSEIALGDSVAVDGVCLTVVEKGDQRLRFDVSQESLSRSTLGLLQRQDKVHLERALQLSARLGGHLVQGHVDAVAQLSRLTKRGEATQVDFTCPRSVGRYLIEKGSIAIDGVSLTVNERSDEGFSVVLIPHTMSKTHLITKGVGAKVNIEIDLIAKYVERLLLSGRETGGVTLDLLREQGYLK